GGREEAGWLFAHPLGTSGYQYASMGAVSEGRYSLSRTLASEAGTACDSQNMPVGSALAEMTLGNVDLAEGRYEEASARFLRALEVALDFGHREMLARFLEGFSGLASALGQHQRALRLGGAADALHEAEGA